MANYCLLILSCDKYSSLWSPFFDRLKKYWPNDGATRYLVTNYMDPDIEGVEILRLGEDIDWSSNLQKALHEIESEYIFILLEDIFIKRKVDLNLLQTSLSFLDGAKPNYLNTKSRPRPRGAWHGSLIREIVKGSHYRSSVTNVFWRKETLLNLLVSGETPWKFEKNGSIRSNLYDGFYGMTNKLLDFHHIIIGGKLARNITNIDDVCSSQISEDFSVLSKNKWIIFKLSVARNIFFSFIIPQGLQQKIRSYFH